MNTKVDWFIGTVFAGEAEISDEMFETLIDHATNYLRATGQITWSEWQCLTAKSRAAFEEAGKRIDEQRTAKIAELIAAKLCARSDPFLDREVKPTGTAP